MNENTKKEERAWINFPLFRLDCVTDGDDDDDESSKENNGIVIVRIDLEVVKRSCEYSNPPRFRKSPFLCLVAALVGTRSVP